MKKKFLYKLDEKYGRIISIFEYTDELRDFFVNYDEIELEKNIEDIQPYFHGILNDDLIEIPLTQEEIFEQENIQKNILKEERLLELRELLYSSDWKVIVNNELIHAGLNPKFDPIELHNMRQLWRDEINSLEKD